MEENIVDLQDKAEAAILKAVAKAADDANGLPLADRARLMQAAAELAKALPFLHDPPADTLASALAGMLPAILDIANNKKVPGSEVDGPPPVEGGALYCVPRSDSHK